MDHSNSALKTLPQDLFVSKLPNGEKEFFCFLLFPNEMDQTTSFTWKITSSPRRDMVVDGERSLTEKEREQHRVSISAILPSEFETGELAINFASYQPTWHVNVFKQKDKFRLPLEGQVLVLIGHRIGETHRSAQIGSQHFAWDLLPLHHDGLRLLNQPLSERLKAQDFEGFGQPVLAPASGIIVKTVDGFEDLTHVGELPTNLGYYFEDLTRAPGNHVIIDHGNGIYSLLAHLQHGSVQVKEGQPVKTLDKVGQLGNSGFSSGPHVHLHFMNGPDMLTASPIPIELDLEGGTYAPQAGEITSS